MGTSDSPFDELARALESALAARRARLDERIRRVELALITYRRAVETGLAREFAKEHGLAAPAAASPSAERAAELLLLCVKELPELESRPTETIASEVKASPSRASSIEPSPSVAPEGLPDSQRAYPHLQQRAEHGRIVIIGALSGRDKASALPTALSLHAEWIDTERDGAHAVGNLPQRIRQGRVGAVIILDRVVQHKHTDGVMSAAREADVPLAFAGQGGRASLLRALEQMELALGRK